MAEALGIVSSIISILQLANSTAKYCISVKDASKECKALLSEILATRGFLEMLKDSLDATEHDVLKSLGDPQGPLGSLQEALQQLQSILDRTVAARGFKKLGKSLIWPCTKEKTLDLLRIVERQKSLLGLALHNDSTELSRSIKADIAETRKEISAVHEETQRIELGIEWLKLRDRDQHDQKIMLWISSVDYLGAHKEFTSEREPNTGNWFLQSIAYNEWLSGAQNNMFCVGIAGAGKTVLESLVIDDLRMNHLGSEQKIGLAWIYCDFAKKQTQNATNNMCSILRQMVEGLAHIPKEVRNLYISNKDGLSPLLFRECISAIRAVADMYTRVFIIVDALDEYDAVSNRDDFISELKELPANIQLLLTCRPVKTLQEAFSGAIQIEIEAQRSDIEKYVEARLNSSESLAKLVCSDDELSATIKSKIIEKSRGMFLMVKLHMDNLAKKAKRTKHEFRNALDQLPEKLNELYDNAFERIKNQDEDNVVLAIQVLSWVSLAYEPLSIGQLQHAIAIQNGLSEQDPECLFDGSQLISVCGGLITSDQAESEVRFVHFTAAEYFSRHDTVHSQRAEEQIVSTCLAHLRNSVQHPRFYSFHGVPREYLFGPQYQWDLRVDYNQEIQDELRQSLPLLAYAVRYLVPHSRRLFQRDDTNTNLLESIRSFWMHSQSRVALRAVYISLYDRARTHSRMTSTRYAINEYPLLDDLDFAVYFGVKSAVSRILTQRITTTSKPLSDKSLCRPVCIAAFNGYDEILELLLGAGACLSGFMNVRLDMNLEMEADYDPPLDERAGNGQHQDLYAIWSPLECAIASNKPSTIEILQRFEGAQ